MVVTHGVGTLCAVMKFADIAFRTQTLEKEKAKDLISAALSLSMKSWRSGLKSSQPIQTTFVGAIIFTSLISVKER